MTRSTMRSGEQTALANLMGSLVILAGREF